MSDRRFTPRPQAAVQPAFAVGTAAAGDAAGASARRKLGGWNVARRLRRPKALAVGLAALALFLAGWMLWPDRGVDVRAGTTLVGKDGMAARYGIEVTLVSVTAAGGLVDFRFQVVDPDKASPIIHDRTLFPKLINEATGATVGISSLPHNHKAEIELGARYFFLLANARNTFTPGALATLVIGNARLEHIQVKG